MAKLLIATPAYDPMVWAETYASVVTLDKCGMEVDCFTAQGHAVAKARTIIAQRALDAGADWLLCVDSDNVLPKDALRNLLKHGEDVVFGYYQALRCEPGVTCLYKPGDGYDERFSKRELHALRDKGQNLVEVRGGGFGCVLVRVDVFRRVTGKWFDYVWSAEGRKLSEDYAFCTKCREAGISLFADTRVDCGHVRQEVV